MYFTIGWIISFIIFVGFAILILTTIAEAFWYFIDDKNYKEFSNVAKTIPFWNPFIDRQSDYLTHDDCFFMIMPGTLIWLITGISAIVLWPVFILLSITIPTALKIRKDRRLKKEWSNEYQKETKNDF